jgi:hypothetical protein
MIEKIIPSIFGRHVTYMNSLLRKMRDVVTPIP